MSYIINKCRGFCLFPPRLLFICGDISSGVNHRRFIPPSIRGFLGLGFSGFSWTWEFLFYIGFFLRIGGAILAFLRISAAVFLYWLFFGYRKTY